MNDLDDWYAESAGWIGADALWLDRFRAAYRELAAVREREARLREALLVEAGINYTGPDPSVECGYPPCTNRLRAASRDFGPQFCSREHRALADGEGET